VCIHPAYDLPDASNDVVGTTRLGEFASATVWIYVERIRATRMNDRELTVQTTAHEFGHAMGLRHSASGELMAAGVFDQAHSVTAADVAQFWAIRNE
jgi:predicted Zn-dependent protease